MGSDIEILSIASHLPRNGLFCRQLHALQQNVKRLLDICFSVLFCTLGLLANERRVPRGFNDAIYAYSSINTTLNCMSLENDKATQQCNTLRDKAGYVFYKNGTSSRRKVHKAVLETVSFYFALCLCKLSALSRATASMERILIETMQYFHSSWSFERKTYTYHHPKSSHS